MERLLWCTTLMSLALIAMVLFALRRSHIRVEYSVSWLVACAALFALSRAEGTLTWIAAQLGLGFAPAVLIIAAGFIFVVMFFWACVVLSRLKDDNIALAQRVAILEFQLNRAVSAKNEVR